MLLKKTGVFVSVSLFSMSLFAHAPSPKPTQLKLITNKIENIRTHLLQDLHKKNYLQGNLEKTEKSIGKIAKQLHHTNVSLKKFDRELNANQIKQANYQAQLDKQEKLLAEQTKAIYMLGRQPSLKIILNQQDPIKISRYLHYYAVLNNTRLQIIQSIQNTTEQLTNNAKDIQAQAKQLTKSRTEQQKQHQSLAKEKTYRKYLLQHTQNSIRSQQETLNKLMQDKQQFEHVVASLHEQESLGYAPGQSFQQMRGRLLWPIAQTKILQPYGASMAGGRLQSTGIVMRAKMGDPVRAIFPGKIIFANWLNGFGLLVIVQHGQNYMTLYGRNQSLYVKKGEEVSAGEVIATAGNSGGFDSPTLYFEIRYQGKPLNPARWLSSGQK